MEAGGEGEVGGGMCAPPQPVLMYVVDYYTINIPSLLLHKT